MIKETATVVAVDGDVVTVEAAIKSTCNACQAQSDCTTGFRHELWAMLPSALVTYAVYKAIAYKLRRIENSKYQPVLLGLQSQSTVDK
jgi:positive regulator of sigma E activity